MLVSDLTNTSRRIAASLSRTAKIGLLSSLLRRLDSEEIEIAVAWLSGRLRQGRIGLGPAAIQAAWNAPHATDATLTLAEVDAAFELIATLSGPGSIAQRAAMLAELLGRATGDEAEFLARLILGELRQGALAGIMEEALANAAFVPIADVRRAVMLAGDLDAVARAALTHGLAGLGRFRLRLFQPVHPMLAQPIEDLDAAFEKLGEVALEHKLDGARIQVHKSGSEVRVYSRLLNDVTAAAPEVAEMVQELPAGELILDGEVIALGVGGEPHPFQVTMRRFGRRLDVERMREELPLTPFFFDLLRLDGSDLFDAPARERFAALREAAPNLAVSQLVTHDLRAGAAFYDEALRKGHEGVMAKALDAPYEAGRRGYAWLKVKREHSLDLVVLAAEWGHGRRKDWLSNIHLGARDAGSGEFVMLGKTFKGMTDAMLGWQTERFQDLAVSTDGYTVRLRPEQVVEVTFNDVQESPQYPAGMALRFARVKRYRDDKSAAEADTIEAVRALLPKSSARPQID